MSEKLRLAIRLSADTKAAVRAFADLKEKSRDTQQALKQAQQAFRILAARIRFSRMRGSLPHGAERGARLVVFRLTASVQRHLPFPASAEMHRGQSGRRQRFAIRPIPRQDFKTDPANGNAGQAHDNFLLSFAWNGPTLIFVMPPCAGCKSQLVERAGAFYERCQPCRGFDSRQSAQRRLSLLFNIIFPYLHIHRPCGNAMLPAHAGMNRVGCPLHGML